MSDYYLDIETVPLQPWDGQKWPEDPSKLKIITIQFQPLDKITGRPIGKLTILKEWEKGSSEKYILEKLKRIYIDYGIWNFIPVGNNLSYEFRLLGFKFGSYFDIKDLSLYERPHIELKSILIIHNRGIFKGYSRAIGKKGLSANMYQWYTQQRFDQIERYITDEAKDFIEAYRRLKQKIPQISLN